MQHIKRLNLSLVILVAWTAVIAAVAAGVLGVSGNSNPADTMSTDDLVAVGRVLVGSVLWLGGVVAIAAIAVVKRLPR